MRLPGTGRGVAGEKPVAQNDRQFRIVLSAALRDLPSIELSRQPDIGDQHVRNVALAPRQCLPPVLTWITW
ncbi:hypothetical protein ACVIHI_008243 [Bradyrhizobium sp. USDA 4524]|nr:hypothetical protein [Bradyrhizobium sp. USDA 4538]MCP1899403.1 hypothetical protein [Bradyrhizobium sp. USDA 4537]MCP1986486.1 hypothetical protein [Bradyrhizobium sp. USDA 4539]